MTNNFSDLESEFKIDDIYSSFKLLLVADLKSSARVSKNGLDTLLTDVMQWMFRSHPVKVPAVIGQVVQQISVPESSFVSKLEL